LIIAVVFVFCFFFEKLFLTVVIIPDPSFTTLSVVVWLGWRCNYHRKKTLFWTRS